MRIAMFADAYKPQINGMVTSIDSFVEELRRHGHEVHIFAPKCDDAKKERFVHRFESVRFSAYPEYKIGMPLSLFFNELFRKKRFDIVHVHSPFSMGIAGLYISRHYKIPVVGTFHTMFSEYPHYFITIKKFQKSIRVKSIFRKFAWKYLSWFYNQCDVVIAPSDEIRGRMRKNGIKKEVLVIPTGTHINKRHASRKRRAMLRRKYGFSYGHKIILHVGRVTKEKDITAVINAAGMLAEKDKNIRLIIASDGPYMNELRGAVKKRGMEDVVTFTGYVPKKDLDELYTISDAFAFASKTETQGIVLADAAVNGLPVVVLNAPVTADFVKKHNAGYVAGSRDFHKKIRKALYEGKRAHADMREYDIGACTGRLLDAYKRAICQ